MDAYAAEDQRQECAFEARMVVLGVDVALALAVGTDFELVEILLVQVRELLADEFVCQFRHGRVSCEEV